MTGFETILDWRATFAVGWALWQFLWQGSVIALLLAVTLPVLRHRDPRERYALCVGGMGVMLLTFAATFVEALRARAMGPGAIEFPALSLGVGMRLDDASWLRRGLPWAALAWGLGALALQLRLLAQWRYTQVLRAQVVPADATLQETFEALRRRMGIDRVVHVARTALLPVPAVLGWWRPVVLVPLGIAESITVGQLRAILAHELAHVRRHDQLVNWIQGIFESLLFFHPAVWWLSRRIRVEREFCCDDVAVAACGDALSYARALSKLEDTRATQLQVAMASTGGSLMMRITRLFSGSASRPTSRWSLVALPGLFVALAFLAVSCSRTDSGDPASPTTVAPSTQSDAGDGASFELHGLEHDPDASPHEILKLGRLHIKKQLAAGEITHDEAKAHLKLLEDHVHEAMGLSPEDVEQIKRRVLAKFMEPETQEILKEFGTVVEFKNGEGSGFFINKEAMSDLPPEDAARLKKLLAEIKAEAMAGSDWETQWQQSLKLHENKWHSKESEPTDPDD
jgi:Zn-dependent protease with chaperone function